MSLSFKLFVLTVGILSLMLRSRIKLFLRPQLRIRMKQLMLLQFKGLYNENYHGSKVESIDSFGLVIVPMDIFFNLKGPSLFKKCKHFSVL
jgi:hypothetical protein